MFVMILTITFQTISQKFCLTFLEPSLTISGNVSSSSRWSSAVQLSSLELKLKEGNYRSRELIEINHE